MTAQLDMFAPAGATAPAAAADNSLVGLAITLPERCSRCSGHDAVIGAGRGPHKASIMCVCGRHLGWMSLATFNLINATVQQFGRPTEPICVSRQRRFDEEPPHASNGEANKQRHIEEINTLIALEGFAPKDFFLTQPPPRMEKTELARWRARERRRRPIARRMAMLGLTTHDLAREPISVTRKPPTATAEMTKSPTTAMQTKGNGHG